MRQSRQIGFLKAQIDYIKSDNLLSEIQDLDYLRQLEGRLSKSTSNLIAKGVIVEDPLGELKKHYETFWTLHRLAKEMDSSGREFDDWINAGVYYSSHIKTSLRSASSKLENLPSKIDELESFGNYCQSVEMWDNNFEVCPFITAYSMFAKEGFAEADTDGDGMLSLQEMQNHKSKQIFLGNKLRHFLSDPVQFAKKMSDALLNSISRIEGINAEYIRLFELLNQVDSQLENGDIATPRTLLENTRHFPEIHDAIGEKLKPFEAVERELTVLAGELEAFAQPRKIPWFTLGKRTTDLSNAVDSLRSKKRAVRSKFTQLPTGCRNFLEPRWKSLETEFSLLDEYCKKLRTKRKVSWVLCITIPSLIFVASYAYISNLYAARDAALAEKAAEREKELEQVRIQSKVRIDKFQYLKAKIARLHEELLSARSNFKGSGELNYAILNEEKVYSQDLDVEIRQFQDDNAIDRDEYLDLRKSLGLLTSNWKHFYAEVKMASGLRIDKLLGEVESIGDSLSRVDGPKRTYGLMEMGRILDQITEIDNKSPTNLKMSAAQERRFRNSHDRRSDFTDKIRNANVATDYLSTLEQDLQSDALSLREAQATRLVLSHRDKFSDLLGELKMKLLVKHTVSWDELVTNHININSDDSKEEYLNLKSIVTSQDLQNLWCYRLVKCVALKTARDGIYNTNKEPVLPQLLSYGEVIEKKSQRNFDDAGNPIANPPVTITQTGTFHWKGKKESREFPSTHFNGGIEGLMLDSAQLSPESKFVKLLVDRYLDRRGWINISLVELLEKVISEKAISDLFKAYLHMEIVKMIKKNPPKWGVHRKSKLLQDYDDLNSKVRVVIRAKDWMDPKNHIQLSSLLSEYYQSLGKTDYLSESLLCIDFLKQLIKIQFIYVGFVDDSGRANFTTSSPSVFWGLEGIGNKLELVQGSSSHSKPKFQSRSPLISTNPSLDEIVDKVYLNSKIQAGAFGTLDDFIPIDFSVNR